MCGAMLVAAAVALGVDAGWQPLADGRMEYIIQIEPHQLKSLAAGDEIVCDIPPGLKRIANYRVRVGTAPLPHVDPPEPEEPQTPPPGEPATTPPEGLRPAPAAPISAWPTASGENVSQPPIDDAAPLGGTRADGSASRERQVSYNETESPSDEADSPEEPAAATPQKPWLPFTLALAAFFGALGGMLFTSWVAWDYRSRYRTLLEKMLDADTPPDQPSDETE